MNNLEFVKSLYDYAEEEIQSLYRKKKEDKDSLLEKIAKMMLIYTVVDGVMKLSKDEKSKEYNKLSKLIIAFTGANIGQIQGSIDNILADVSKKTFEHYSYNAKNKVIKDIVKNNFKNKHFSERVWDNEKATGELLQKKVYEFIDGKINVNNIKSTIDKVFNNSAYEIKRLVETEVSRVHNESFMKFCEETGVKKVKYNATLDNRTCEDCMEYDGEIYGLYNAPSLPRHPLCRCFLQIID